MSPPSPLHVNGAEHLVSRDTDNIHLDILTQFLVLVVSTLIVGAGLLIAYTVRDVWLQKHTAFPYTGSRRERDSVLRSDAFAYTANYVQTHKTAIVGSDIFYSDLPFWSNPCGKNQYAVRVVAPVIDPTSGGIFDVKMLFCFQEKAGVYPADQRATFYTSSVP